MGSSAPEALRPPRRRAIDGGKEFPPTERLQGERRPDPLGVPLQDAIRITGRHNNRHPRRQGSGSQRKLQSVVGPQANLGDEDQGRTGSKKAFASG